MFFENICSPMQNLLTVLNANLGLEVILDSNLTSAPMLLLTKIQAKSSNRSSNPQSFNQVQVNLSNCGAFSSWDATASSSSVYPLRRETSTRTYRTGKIEEEISTSDTHPAMRSLAPLNLQMHSVSESRSVFACFLCGKTFGLKHNLYRHLRTHTGERPHQCPHCEYNGTRRSHVQTHINRVHQRHDQSKRLAGSQGANTGTSSQGTTNSRPPSPK